MSTESLEQRDQRRDAFVDAICGRGWDAPSTATAERAEQCLKADPELCTEDFVLACATGAVATVRRSLDADPGLITRELGPRGWQPLVYVAYSILSRRRDERAARITQVGALLLERGANANSGYVAQSASDAKPSRFPVLFMRPGTDQMVELLLERGANAREKTRAGLSALDLAERRHGRVEIAATLERYGSTRGERTFLDELIVAAAYGDEARARALLDAHPSLSSALVVEDRSLVAAFAEAGNRQGALILARLGFDLATPSWMGMTALHWAACRGNPELVRGLLDAGAPFVDAPGFGTPLHTALYQR